MSLVFYAVIPLVVLFIIVRIIPIKIVNVTAKPYHELNPETLDNSLSKVLKHATSVPYEDEQ